MKVEAMREKIMQVYSGPIWRIRVETMPENQVIAIYKRMQEDGTFDKLEKEKRKKGKSDIYCEQMTIFDLLKDDKGD